MRSKIAKILLITWCLFIGIGAMFGGISMLIKPDGSILQMQEMLSYFEVLPFSKYLFQDYTFAGISLIIVNGISNLIAAYLMLRNKKIGIVLGTIFGFTLMLWITIQFIIFPFNILSTSYFIFGILQLLTGIAALIFYKQEHFIFNEKDYQLPENSNTLVVYFSRMNYTKKIAYQFAEKNHAEILEITTNEHTKKTSGFWWCGRFGMHHWPMPINEKIDLKKYQHLIICTPIWVFDIAAPIRDFLNKYSEDIKMCDIVLVHFNKMKYKYIYDKLIKNYHLNINKRISICTRIGKIKYQGEIHEANE